jgi:hypothetical protein
MYQSLHSPQNHGDATGPCVKYAQECGVGSRTVLKIGSDAALKSPEGRKAHTDSALDVHTVYDRIHAWKPTQDIERWSVGTIQSITQRDGHCVVTVSTEDGDVGEGLLSELSAGNLPP